MAYIKTLKDNELIGGVDNTDVYPVSTTQALYSQDAEGNVRMSKTDPLKPEKLEERIEDNESDAQELHRKTEKLCVYLVNNKSGQTLEITGSDNTMTLSGSAQIETFGDEPADTIAPGDMTSKTLSVIFGAASSSVEGHIDGNNWVGTYTFPNVVGTYTARFECGYNGILKHTDSNTYVNLRKYFGFASNTPSDVTALGTSHFSNSVACTVTIPTDGTGFKHIYFAVPNAMEITRVTQPDALNAPLDIEYVGTVTRTIDGTDYTYKLYQSVDLIDSSSTKRLTIS